MHKATALSADRGPVDLKLEYRDKGLPSLPAKGPGTITGRQLHGPET